MVKTFQSRSGVEFKELKETVIRVRTDKLKFIDRSVIKEFTKKFKIRSNKQLGFVELLSRKGGFGLNTLIKIRLGIMNFNNQLSARGIVPIKFKNSCICCKAEVTEDVEHLILDWEAFKEERDRVLPKLKDLLSSSIRTDLSAKILNILTKLLGGEWQSSLCQNDRWILELIKYLSYVIPKR